MEYLLMPILTATLSYRGSLVHEYAPGVYIAQSTGRGGGRVITKGAMDLSTDGYGIDFEPAEGEFEVDEGVIRVAAKYQPGAFE
jgi:hypothetical protein